MFIFDKKVSPLLSLRRNSFIFEQGSSVYISERCAHSVRILLVGLRHRYALCLKYTQRF